MPRWNSTQTRTSHQCLSLPTTERWWRPTCRRPSWWRNGETGTETGIEIETETTEGSGTETERDLEGETGIETGTERGTETGIQTETGIETGTGQTETVIVTVVVIGLGRKAVEVAAVGVAVRTVCLQGMVVQQSSLWRPLVRLGLVLDQWVLVLAPGDLCGVQLEGQWGHWDLWDQWGVLWDPWEGLWALWDLWGQWDPWVPPLKDRQ